MRSTIRYASFTGGEEAFGIKLPLPTQCVLNRVVIRQRSGVAVDFTATLYPTEAALPDGVGEVEGSPHPETLRLMDPVDVVAADPYAMAVFNMPNGEMNYRDFDATITDVSGFLYILIEPVEAEASLSAAPPFDWDVVAFITTGRVQN